MTIRIVTDSTCDLPTDIVQEHAIEVVPLYINIGDDGYLDGVEITRSEFYTGLPDYKDFPTTAVPGIEAFRKAYERLAQEGASEILSIHISKSLSSTVDVARSAARACRNLPVRVLDSHQLSLGTGFLVEAAAKAARAGRQMQEILAQLQDQMERTHVFAALDTLEFLKRSGRMNGVVAGIGSLLQIKPLLKMHAGEPTSERVRTSNGAFGRILELLRERSPLERVALVHTHCSDKANALRLAAKDLLPEGRTLSVDISPVIGAHLGPGAAGFACIKAR